MSITQDENLMLELYRQARDKGLSNEAALAVVTSQLADITSTLTIENEAWEVS